MAVADRHPFEGDPVGGVDVVGTAGGAGQREPAGDVVVVQVRLEDVGDPHVTLASQHQYPVDVPLRVYHEGDLAVGDQVAPVAERRSVDLDYLDHLDHPLTCPVSWRTTRGRPRGRGNAVQHSARAPRCHESDVPLIPGHPSTPGARSAWAVRPSGRRT